MNSKNICTGAVTRHNRRVETEKSAIDFIDATYEASQWFKTMNIDELEDHRVRNKNDSDHNTIVADIMIKEIKADYQYETSDWNYRAAPEK